MAIKIRKETGVFLTFLLLLAFLAALRLFFVHPLVRNVYAGKGPSILNSMICGQHVHPVDHYLNVADRYYYFLAFVMSGILVCFIFSSVRRYVLTLLRYAMWLSIPLLVVLLIASEIFFALCFRHPEIARFIPRNEIRKWVYCSRIHRVIPESLPRLVYDSEVTYTMPPSATFKKVAPEYEVVVRTNSEGLRDDEESLNAPEVIVLGDSEAMGQGVEQDQTYAAILERESGFKVLNAAVGSFGTVREMILLNRLETTRLKYLIIDYHPNDYDENRYFYEHGRLDITPREKVEALWDKEVRAARYYSGKYTVYAVIGLLESIKARSIVQKKENEAKYFLHAVSEASKKNLRGVKIVSIVPGPLSEQIRQELSLGEYPDPVSNMMLVSENEIREKCFGDCYYPFDGHRKAKAYRLFADRILDLIARSQDSEP
ncbi:MAG: hypothetical protein JW893_01015 [Candidatus Omnitrophica bacterium]|nr:hypothetical protein [Candidatus Omnitrophota bacterium]